MSGLASISPWIGTSGMREIIASSLIGARLGRRDE